MNLNELLGLNSLAFKADGHDRWQDFFGLELEVEQARIGKMTGEWTTHEDQSLRSGGVEFVTSTPMGGALLDKAITDFYAAGHTYSAGPRTSTHIHVNMTDTTLEHLRTMLCVVYAIEDALFNVVGESRKWSGYAMPLSEMDPTRLRGIMQESNRSLLLAHLAPSRNAERYYGCNTAALRRFGTLEFRYFPGGPSREELESWITLFANLKENTRKLSISDLERIETAGQFLDLLVTVLGREMTLHLATASTSSEMFDKFTEIVTMAEGADTPDRRERLVFLTPQLMTFVGSKILKEEEQREWFREQLEPHKVVSQNDFIWYTRNAVAQSKVAFSPTGRTNRLDFGAVINASTPRRVRDVIRNNNPDAPYGAFGGDPFDVYNPPTPPQAMPEANQAFTYTSDEIEEDGEY